MEFRQLRMRPQAVGSARVSKIDRASILCPTPSALSVAREQRDEMRRWNVHIVAESMEPLTEASRLGCEEAVIRHRVSPEWDAPHSLVLQQHKLLVRLLGAMNANDSYQKAPAFVS